MRKNIKIIAIVFGTLVIASLTLPVLATKMTTVSFGIGTNPKPLWTIRGLYDKSQTVFSGITYYLKLNPDNGTFVGWIMTTNGEKLEAHGTYTILNNRISGQWYLSDGYYGWVVGSIGI